ncbi:MAG TPA: 4-hydroxy-2-oxovalerate aldolase [Solirubrobacterales bacterium]|nr:4-hydroxy-2-oxovalerate aldolase [Solirubrobacterales bacterium]
MSGRRAVKIIDTTVRDGSHSVAHRFTPAQVATVAGALDRAGVWAVAVGHGDGLGAGSRQYGFAAHPDHELIAAAAAAMESSRIATALLPGIGTKEDLRAAHDAGASVVRVSTVCTEADIGVQHLGLARELGMLAHSHLNMAHIASPERIAENALIVAAAGGEAVYLVDSAGALMRDDVRAAVAALREALPAEVEIGIHEHNNLSLAVANSVAAIEEGATIVDVTLAGMGAGAGNCQAEPLVAVLDRLGYETGVDLLALQDVADGFVRPELMPGPIVIDRLTGTLGYAGVPASFLLHAIRAGERFDVDPREIVIELGRRKAVVGQEDMIIDVAAALAG